MTAQLLVVEDEPAIRRLVRGAVERAGFTVAEAGNAAEALVAARHPGCELVLLDLGLPDRDGMELVPLLEALDRAVIVLTARDETAEQVAALELGADDYVVKPFNADELLARVRSALRHRTPWTALGIAKVEDILVDILAQQVDKKGHRNLPHPHGICGAGRACLHPCRVVTHNQLLRTIRGEAHTGDTEYLRVAVRSLRLKLEDDPAAPGLIQNEPGIGYRLC